jgi:membrane-associated phospholipid phosphatase
VCTRLQAHWRLKLRLTVVLNLFFWAGYALLSRHAFFPLHTLPLTWLDRTVPFQPEPWGWVYLSQFLFTGTLPWLIPTNAGLRRYVTGLIFMSTVSFAIFLFFPVASPHPSSLTATGAMGWIVGYDGPFNAFPSLHAGFLIYMASLTWRMFRGRLSGAVICGGLVWGALILYATLATRQHYALDLVAGAALGYAADRLAWRGSSGASAAATMALSNGVASHDGCK